MEAYQEKLMKLLLDVIGHGKQEGYIDPQLPNSLIISVLQLFNKDIVSKNSILLANHLIAEVLEIIIWEFQGGEINCQIRNLNGRIKILLFPLPSNLRFFFSPSSKSS